MSHPVSRVSPLYRPGSAHFFFSSLSLLYVYMRRRVFPLAEISARATGILASQASPAKRASLANLARSPHINMALDVLKRLNI